MGRRTGPGHRRRDHRHRRLVDPDGQRAKSPKSLKSQLLEGDSIALGVTFHGNSHQRGGIHQK